MNCFEKYYYWDKNVTLFVSLMEINNLMISYSFLMCVPQADETLNLPVDQLYSLCSKYPGCNTVPRKVSVMKLELNLALGKHKKASETSSCRCNGVAETKLPS